MIPSAHTFKVCQQVWIRFSQTVRKYKIGNKVMEYVPPSLIQHLYAVYKVKNNDWVSRQNLFLVADLCEHLRLLLWDSCELTSLCNTTIFYKSEWIILIGCFFLWDICIDVIRRYKCATFSSDKHIWGHGRWRATRGATQRNADMWNCSDWYCRTERINHDNIDAPYSCSTCKTWYFLSSTKMIYPYRSLGDDRRRSVY